MGFCGAYLRVSERRGAKLRGVGGAMREQWDEEKRKKNLSHMTMLAMPSKG